MAEESTLDCIRSAARIGTSGNVANKTSTSGLMDSCVLPLMLEEKDIG
jgi:hypothetical protein